MLRVRSREITVEVNSVQRLTALYGDTPQGRRRPGGYLGEADRPGTRLRLGRWPARSQGGAAAAAEGWEKFWLDEKVPALFGRTPRQAARGRERPYLEALLRQFEYEADLLAADGKTGVDTASLREQLDMPTTSPTERSDGAIAHPARQQASSLVRRLRRGVLRDLHSLPPDRKVRWSAIRARIESCHR